MLTEATERLIATARNAAAGEADWNAAAQRIFEAVGRSSRAEANEALRTLGQHLDLADRSRAALLALIGGALVEHGCDPTALAGLIAGRPHPGAVAAAARGRRHAKA